MRSIPSLSPGSRSVGTLLKQMGIRFGARRDPTMRIWRVSDGALIQVIADAVRVWRLSRRGD